MTRRRTTRDDEWKGDELSQEAPRSFAVDKALLHHENDGVLEYLVKWKDFFEASWETEDAFECDGGFRVLGEYWREKYMIEEVGREQENALRKGKQSVSKFTF